MSGNFLSRLSVAPLTRLRELKVAGNLLTELPQVMPESLECLDISRNRLSAVARLPDGLQVLAIDRNQLLALPAGLPSGLPMAIGGRQPAAAPAG